MPFEHLALLVRAARWALAAVLVLQVFLGGAVPTVIEAVVLLTRPGGAGSCAGRCDLALPVAIPWVLFLAVHLLQVRVLRRLGGFPYSDRQVALMALLPGYNLRGAVELFSAQGEAMERLGAARHVGLELRAAAAMASGLAVAQALILLRVLRPFDAVPALVAAPAAARSVFFLTLTVLFLRLYVLARVELAMRPLVASGRAAALREKPPTAAPPGLPGLRSAAAAVVLALAAAGFALKPIPRLAGELAAAPVAGASPSVAGAVPEVTLPVPAAAAAPAQAPRAPEPPSLPTGYLLAGRPVEWWRDRLTLLRARSDDAGHRMFELTRERAVANGLIVMEREGRVAVEPSPALVAAAREEATR